MNVMGGKFFVLSSLSAPPLCARQAGPLSLYMALEYIKLTYTHSQTGRCAITDNNRVVESPWRGE